MLPVSTARGTAQDVLLLSFSYCALSRPVLEYQMKMCLGGKDMTSEEQKAIRLVVESEQTLYSRFSPEDEFDASVKSYIRTKIAAVGRSRNISLTVLSQKPLDEKRFLSALSNWGRDEKAAMRTDMKDTIRMLIGMLVFGSIMIILSVMMQERFAEVQYSLMPIMGSLALGKVAEILIVNIPIFNARKKMIDDMGKGTSVTFEYVHGEKDMRPS